MKYKIVSVSLLVAAAVFTCGRGTEAAPTKKIQKGGLPVSQKINKSEAEWQKILSPEQFYILRKQGTERPFTGKYHDHHEKGTYVCAACGTALFESSKKFESGTGWPSFYEPVKGEHVEELSDTSHGMVRVEVRCGKCGGHLGHVFDDGPKPTGLRYCINSASLDFKK
jgi:peptide-methionine (R)-S-oxide reductase